MTVCARNGDPVTVLLIEDDPDDALLIRALLVKSRYEFELLWRDRLDLGLECAAEDPVELVLLDLSLPDSQGIETVERAVAALGAVPVVVISGLDDPEAERKALVAGAQEYLVKGPMDQNQLARLLIHAIERAAVERVLDEKDAFARAVIEQSAEAIYFSDPDSHTVVLANPAFERLLGYDQAAAGLPLAELIDAELESIRARTEQVMATGAGEPIERNYRHFDGRLIPVEVTASAISLSGRRMLCNHVRDITERQQAEDAQRRLSAALDSAAESVIITDPRGTISYVNQAFETVTGYTAAEVIGHNTKILSSGEHPPAFYAEMWNTILDGRVWFGRVTNRRKDGSLYVAAMNIAPVRDNAGDIAEFIAIQQDVTAEVELQRRLSRSQTLEAVGQLAGGVAHDFNNILMAVQGFAEVVADGMAADDPRREDLQEILNAAERGAGLAHQLLAFGRQEAGQPAEIALNTVLQEVEKMIRRTIGEDILLTLELAGDLPKVFIDPVHLHQVVLNLVVNARDAMPHGGELRIRSLLCPVDEGVTVCLEVTDTGCGMSAEVQARIFEPYFSTKEVGSRSGFGLGLATVYGIVRQAGGRIEVASAVGSGSAFQVHLPPAVEAGPGRTPSDAEPLPVGRGETLLVVEDDPAVAGPVARLLTNGNYRVLMAYSGQEALRLAADHGRELDMLITDVIMPGMSGPELAELLVQTHPGLRVLFVSGYAGAPIADHGIDPARQPFLAKPFTKDALLRKIRQVLGDGAATDA